MILKSKHFDNTLHLSNSHISSLSMTSKGLFRTIVSDIDMLMNGQDNENLSIKNSKLDNIKYTKDCFFCLSPYSIDFNSKKIQTALISKIIKTTDDKTTQKILDAENIVLSLVEEKLTDFEFPVAMGNEMEDITNILKKLGLYIEVEDLSLFERLQTFSSIVSEFKLYSLLIFVNLKSYFSGQEILSLEKSFLEKNLTVLLIDYEVSPTSSAYEEAVTIDDGFEDIKTSPAHINRKTKAYFEYME